METNPRERVDVDERRTRFDRLRTGSGEAAAAEADLEPQQRQRANGGVNGKGRNRKQNVIFRLFDHAVMTCDDLINNALRGSKQWRPFFLPRDNLSALSASLGSSGEWDHFNCRFEKSNFPISSIDLPFLKPYFPLPQRGGHVCLSNAQRSLTTAGLPWLTLI